MKAYLLLLFTFFSFSPTVFAQSSGTLTGRVTNKNSNEPVIGAVVFITGSTKGASTDHNGNFSIKVEPGIYKIAVTYVSYKQTNLENIKIEAGKTTTLNIKIEEDSKMLNAVTIVGTRQTNTEMSLITEMKKSEIVANGVSGEQIAKSLDRDAAETVKRIPGISIMDNRFIVIRGMNERYNTVMLNDALTPSTETDAKAFSFDILPTSVIDRIMVFKGGSPELPGEFAGGVIKVYTKNFADENTNTFSLSGSYRAGTTFKNFNSYQGSKTDFLGFDNGKRALPGQFPESLADMTNAQRADAGKALENTWTPNQSKAAPDLRASLGMTRRFNIGSTKISNLTAVSYSNTRTMLEANRDKFLFFDEETQTHPYEYSFKDLQSTESVRLGVIHNWSARLSNNHKLEFRNLFNQLGANQTTVRKGFDRSNQQDQENYALRYESRRIYSGQLQGTHDLNNENTTLTWTTGFASTNRNEPDYRRVRTQRAMGSTDAFKVVVPNGPTPKDASRFFSQLNEDTYMASGDAEHRLGQKDSLATDDRRIKLRTGFYAEKKNRDFASRYFSYAFRPDNNNPDLSVLDLPLNQIFAPENIKPNNGFILEEGTNPSDAYTASNDLVAGYVSTSVPVGARLLLAGGARLEYNRQRLSTATSSGPVEVDNPITRLLPSLNISYNLTENQLLRAGTSVSLNRPEFRELAPFTYYDFNTNFEVTGNPELETPTIYNADLRYEYYASPTEVLSAGTFFKHFQNPIENFFIVSSGANSYTFKNAESAVSYGLETEIRKSFFNLSENKFVQNLSLVLNASLIKSQVTLGEEADGQAQDRPMMGQSPYIVNTGLYYQNDEQKFQANLLYNVMGKRIYIVGNYANPTVFEMPRHQIDFTVTKGFGERFQVTAGVQDLLNQRYNLVQDWDQNSQITDFDKSILNYKRGAYTTLGMTYKF
ncbi:TonB-dependent receptor [Adhaeribacter terreus]|uniref:TonB-dependent receptor domain-containing protein n=1 Tax=Adhaeribacter terreus TaxID=529703 RepID=A0ABW0ED43_9BACT